jgi:hypothetical protein
MAEGKVAKLKQDLAAAGEERRELLVGKGMCACLLGKGMCARRATRKYTCMCACS